VKSALKGLRWLAAGALVLDCEARRAMHKGRPLALTPRANLRVAISATQFMERLKDFPWPERVLRLSDLQDDERAEVVGLDEACQGFSRRRLMDLGFTEGAAIRPALRTFSKDPRAYEVRGTLIALRNDQASQVLVRPLIAGSNAVIQGAAS